MKSTIKKSNKHSDRGKKVASSKEWPLVVFIWMIGLGLLGYVFGRIAFDAMPHPVHWLSGLVGSLLGCVIGWLWYRLKGDVL